MSPRPLALTLGDPAGVGPEIIIKAWSALRDSGPTFMVIGDVQTLVDTALISEDLIRRVTSPDEANGVFAHALPVLDLPLRTPVVPGKPTPLAAPAIIQWIETAVGLSLSGQVAGLVTAPISKAPLYEAGFGFPGHTEFLGELTAAAGFDGARGPVMMLAVPGLKTTLVTVHEPLAKVSERLTIKAIVNAGLVTAQALRHDFGIEQPRLAVAGLNPHAGESGSIGREEVEIIDPAVRALKDLGVDATGPWPADSLFPPEARDRFDAALCMYHDQALIPVKMLDFWGGVNVTLGLPVVRTSPDHGTAFDIAGKAIARPDSLIAAIRLARAIADQRAR